MANFVHVALNPWDLEIPRNLNFPVARNLEMKIVRSVHPPRFQTKSLVWTLQELFDEYNSRGLYASANFVARIEGAPLGFGSIRSTLQSGLDGQRNVSSQAMHDRAPAERIPSADDIGSGVIPSSSNKSTPSVISHDPATQLARRGFDIRLEYTPDGALFSDLGFFDSIIHFLSLAANRDPKTSTTRLARSYNVQEGFFVEVASVDEENELEVGTLIEVLGLLPAKMYGQGAGGRWAELTGSVKFDGVKIGRIKVEQGYLGTAASSNRTDWQRVTNDTATETCLQSTDRLIF